MKFQNPSFHFFERTDKRTNGQTNKQTDKPKAICSQLFQSWGHNDVSFFQEEGYEGIVGDRVVFKRLFNS